MIRKAIIAMFTLAAVVTTSVSIFSYTDWPGSWSYRHRASGLEIRHSVTRHWDVGLSRRSSFDFEVSKGRMYGPIRVPLWMCVGMFTGGAVGVARIPDPLIRRHRRARGLCIDCGYDLTGNESGVCPECGEEV